MTIVLMRVKASTYLDIKRRLEDLGPLYTRDFFTTHPREGLVLVFGEVGFVPEPSGRDWKCAICGGVHDQDLLTDICSTCETRINEEGSP